MGLISNSGNSEPTATASPNTAATSQASSANRKESRKRGKGRDNLAQYITDLGTVAFDTATLSAGPIGRGFFRGVENQILDLMKGEGFSKAPWREGMLEGARPNMEARDRLTQGDTTGAQMLGALGGGKTPIGMLDEAALGPVKSRIAPTLGQRFAKKPLRMAAAGGVAGVLEGYTGGDVSFEEMLENGAVGALVAPIAQAAIGDVALPLLARAGRNIGVFDDFGGAVDRLKDNVMSKDGYTLSNLVEAAEALPNKGTVMDLAVGGSRRTAEETPRRFYNAMADLHFGGTKDYNANLPQFLTNKREYEKALSAVERYATEADNDARLSVLNALGNPQSRAETLYESNAALNEARRSMGLMRKTTPNADGSLPLGAQPIDAREFIGGLRTEYMDNLGITSFSDKSEAGRIYDKFTDYLRIYDEEPAALGVAMRASRGKDTIGVPGEDVYEGANVARLLNARTRFAKNYLGPNPNVDPADRAAAAALLKSVDAKIEKLTLGDDSLARQGFAKQMRMQEAYDMGNHFYESRIGDIAGNERFNKHYGDSLDKYLNDSSIDEEERAMFKAGFSKAMKERIGERGFMTEMKYFTGEYVSRPGAPTFFRQNDRGVEQLRQILGEEDAAEVLRVYEVGAPYAEFTSKLSDLLDAKGATPTAKADLIGMATDAVLQADRKSARDGAWDASLAALDYILKPSDRQKARALQRLLSAEGDEVRKYIERGARQSGNLPLSAGVRMVPAANTASESEAEYEAAINAYFDKLSRSGG